jgi:hypothetical protein
MVIAAGLLVVLVGGLVLANALGQDDSDGGNVNTSSTPSPSPTPQASPTALSPRAEVREAYLSQWDVYATAARSLQTDGLAEVFTGKALSVVRDEIRDLRRKGLAVRVEVEHDIKRVRIADAVTALVVDRYTNHSVTIDADTGEPKERDPNQIVLEAYTLKKVEGVWKVSEIARHSVRPARR